MGSVGFGMGIKQIDHTSSAPAAAADPLISAMVLTTLISNLVEYHKEH
jgi:multisubunit Na+/H+ antiporter MnhC subunit